MTDTALHHIVSHWDETVVVSILDQYRDSEKWQGVLKGVIDCMQVGEDAANELVTMLDFVTTMPTGYHLDWLAGLKNVKRLPGESDSSLYMRFVESLGKRNAGTPDAIIRSADQLSGDPHPQYMDEAPATFFVYTGPRPDGNGGLEGGGHQLYRRQVKKLAPAGVLGLPGAAIQLADGSLLGDENGKLILVVADDSTVGQFSLLIDDAGDYVVDDEGNRILTNIEVKYG